MGLRGEAAIVGMAEYPSTRKFTGTPRFSLDWWADLAAQALADAGLDHRDVDGICCAGDVRESGHFTPAAVAEYCGWSVNLAEKLDLGGATPVGMVWRAAAAVELGICDVVVCAVVHRPTPQPPDPAPPDPRMMYGASSTTFGAPEAEFDVPYGNVAQNCGYAMLAQRYGAVYGYDERAVAKIAADQRVSANANPDAAFFDVPATVDDVLASKMVSDPLHLLEIVMPTFGGGCVVVARADTPRRSAHRPVHIVGFGEHLDHKSPVTMTDMTVTPVAKAARSAFAMAGLGPADMDVVQIYDCYTITVLLTLEAAGFCGAGEGMAFVADHDLSYRGDFPCNTHGGQLGFGQPGLGGGMSQITEAVRQVRGTAGDRQVPGVELAFVSGTGGVVSEQSALVLRGG